MKNLIALHAKTPFFHSMIQRMLALHGEKLSTYAFKTGNYYIHDSSTGTWSRTNDTTGMQIIEPVDVKGFLMEYGNMEPIPDPEWMEIDEDIRADKYGYERPLNLGEYLERVAL